MPAGRRSISSPRTTCGSKNWSRPVSRKSWRRGRSGWIGPCCRRWQRPEYWRDGATSSRSDPTSRSRITIREKFDAHGLRPPRTWGELLSVAKTFKEREGLGRVLFQGVGGAPTVTQLYEWIVSAGGDPLDLGHPATVATFHFLRELAPYLSPDSRRAKWDTTNDALAQESAYLAQNWPFGVPLLIREYGKHAIRTYSGWAGPAREAHVIGGDVLGIPVGAPNRDLALRLIRHLQSREIQETLASRLGWPTIRGDAVGALEPWMRPHVVAVQDAMRHGIFRENVPYWADYERIASEAVERILWRKEAVDEALPPLAARLSDLRKGRR